MSIYGREKSVHKAKEPPCDIECNCNGEEDYTSSHELLGCPAVHDLMERLAAGLSSG
jgi:hypothetical protein